MSQFGARHVILMAVGLFVAPAFLYRLIRQHPVDGWTIASVALFVPALALWTAAHFRLGRSFAVRAQAHGLVTEGVYKKIRHPIYISGLLLLLSLIIASRTPQWLAAWAALAVVQVVRARNEERVLEATFGQAYRDYRSRTWF